MNITDFDSLGITFKLLSREDIEIVRLWRNSDDVRPYMQYQELISTKEQKIWFNNLDKTTNYYFLAHKNEEPFGVFNVKDINFNNGFGEAGIFLKDRSFWEGELIIRASIALFKFAFEKLNLKSLNSHVLKTNTRALAFNKQMGFKINENIENSISYNLTLTKKDFFENKIIIKLIRYLNSN